MSNPPQKKRLKQATLFQAFGMERDDNTSKTKKSVLLDQSNYYRPQGAVTVGGRHVSNSTVCEKGGLVDSEAVAARLSSENAGHSPATTSSKCRDDGYMSPDLFSDSLSDTGGGSFSPQAHVDDDDIDQTQKLSPESDTESELDAQLEQRYSELGERMSELQSGGGGGGAVRMWECRGGVMCPKVTSGPQHTVLYDTSTVGVQPPKPYPQCSDRRHGWSDEHVRSPYSANSVYPLYTHAADARTTAAAGSDKEGEFGAGSEELVARAEVIRQNLLKPILDVSQLIDSIMSYNHRFKDRWRFNVLTRFINEMTENEKSIFFNKLLPKIIELALNYEDLFTQGIPLLRSGTGHSISMSQQQAACLLANAALCTFPRRNSKNPGAEYANYPTINFNTLYSGSGYDTQRKVEKLKCIFHYFRRVTQKTPAGTMTLTRRCLGSDECLVQRSEGDSEPISSAQARIRLMEVSHADMIESDRNAGYLQVDFANKFIGGGVLGGGLVQEEVRFVICPEMIVSRLVTERLADNECIILTGCEQYSTYSGYSNTFEWRGDYKGSPAGGGRVEPGGSGRGYSQLVAIDAVHYRSADDQYRPDRLRRELNKAYCGFHEPPPSGSATAADTPHHLASAIATGNWGCGAFNGDPQLKALIQLIAGSAAGRLLVYHTFNSKQLALELINMNLHLVRYEYTVGGLWHLLLTYYGQRAYLDGESVFDFIYRWTAEEQH